VVAVAGIDRVDPASNRSRGARGIPYPPSWFRCVSSIEDF